MPRSERDIHDRPGLQQWHWFVLATAVPIVHCASRLNLDLWHDEIYTIDVFVRHGPAFIVSDYSLPNNHVLFSLLMWPFYCLSDSNFVLRLPSFLLTIGTLVVLFRLAWRLCGLPCAVLSTAQLGLNQMYLNFAIQVRGYGLSMFLSTWLAGLAICESSGSNWRRRVAVTLVGAGLLYTLPSNALFFIPLAALALGRTLLRRASIRESAIEALPWGLAVLLALVLYLPILGQIRSTAQASSSSSWSYLPVIAGNFIRPATHDFVWFAPFVILGLLAWTWPRPDGQSRQWAVPALCGGAIAGAMLLTGLLRISPFERIYCPLLVFLSLAGGWLLAELIETVRNRVLKRASAEAAVGAALACISLAIWPQLWTYPQRLEARRNEVNATEKWPVADGYYCYYAANYRPSAIVDLLLDRRVEHSAYRICVAEVDHLNVWYYFAKAGLPLLNGASADAHDRTTQQFAVVPEPPRWNNLAADCGLSADEINAFRLEGDFGYYRLYQSELTSRK